MFQPICNSGEFLRAAHQTERTKYCKNHWPEKNASAVEATVKSKVEGIRTQDVGLIGAWHDGVHGFGVFVGLQTCHFFKELFLK